MAGFMSACKMSSLKKALTVRSGFPSALRGDRSGKVAGREPSKGSCASTASTCSSSSSSSTCMGSEDSELAEPTAAASIGQILQTLASEPWNAERFDQIRRLEEAARNQGSVELMYDKGTFGKVAVKKMPNKWMQANAAAFAKLSDKESEQPWFDLAVVQWLSAKQFPYSCQLHGIFRDDSLTYVVFELATEGDLLKWCLGLTHQGDARENAIRPVMHKICSAVAWLHDLGLAHGDISLENILVTKSPREEELKVKLIDFGMSTTQRRSVNMVRGKASYQAPEAHVQNVPYDPFFSDVFAMGVTFFCLAAQDMPWMATAPGKCQFWRLASMMGLRSLLGRRKSRNGQQGEFLSEALSPDLIDLLEGMLEVKPGNRLILGETAWSDVVGKKSVWDMAWMNSWAP